MLQMKASKANKGSYLDWLAVQHGPQSCSPSMTTVQLRCRDGPPYPCHRDILAIVCKAAASLAEAEAEGRAEAGGSSSLAALSIATEQSSHAALRYFLGEVYACSGIIKPPLGESGLEAWNALSPEDRRGAVMLADVLHAAAVLERWDAMLAVGSVGPSHLPSSELLARLALADQFQLQLPRAYRALLAAACQRAAKGDREVLLAVPSLSPVSVREMHKSGQLAVDKEACLMT